MIKGNWVYIVLSILAALIVWLYADSLNATQVTVSVEHVPVEFLNEDTVLAERGLMITSGEDATVDLTLKGRRGAIAALDTDDVRVQVDLRGVTNTGRQMLSYKLALPDSVSAADFTLESASTSLVAVTIGELYRKSVEIQVELVGNVADGYLAGSLEIVPQLLELRGEQVDVMQVSYASAVLNITDATSTVVELLEYKLYDHSDQVIEDLTGIHAMAEQIQVTLPVEKVKELPLAVEFIPGPGSPLEELEYIMSLESVTVRGSDARLAEIDRILLDTVDLSTLRSSETTRIYDITLPEGCTLLSGDTTVQVTMSLPRVREQVYSVRQIDYKNHEADSQVTVISTAVEVVLRGASRTLSAITAEDISVTADLSAVASANGTYTVLADVSVPGNRNVGVMKDCYVVITIAHDQPELPEAPQELQAPAPAEEPPGA